MKESGQACHDVTSEKGVKPLLTLNGIRGEECEDRRGNELGGRGKLRKEGRGRRRENKQEEKRGTMAVSGCNPTRGRRHVPDHVLVAPPSLQKYFGPAASRSLALGPLSLNPRVRTNNSQALILNARDVLCGFDDEATGTRAAVVVGRWLLVSDDKPSVSVAKACSTGWHLSLGSALNLLKIIRLRPSALLTTFSG